MVEQNWLNWLRIYYIKAVIILKRIKDEISGQSIEPNNNEPMNNEPI